MPKQNQQQPSKTDPHYQPTQAEMNADISIPDATPEKLARAIFRGHRPAEALTKPGRGSAPRPPPLGHYPIFAHRGTDAHEPPALSGQKLGSCPRSRNGGRLGGDVAGGDLDDVSRAGTGTGRFPSAGRPTSPSPPSTLEGGGGASWCGTVSF